MTNMIKTNVRFEYNTKRKHGLALDDISINIAKGELAILGHNGSVVYLAKHSSTASAWPVLYM